MKTLTKLVTGLSLGLDKIAGGCMVAVMMLVVTNIMLRAIFNRPILGTYEYVVFLTAVLIGLSLAHCALQKGHIAVDFIVDRFPPKVQIYVDALMNTAAFIFWFVCAWQIAVYAQSMTARGLVSPTTQIPVAPFIYLVAFGLLALSLVLLLRTVESVQKAFSFSSSQPFTAPQARVVESIQKAASR